MPNKLLLFLLPIAILVVPVVYSFTPSSSNNRCAVAQVCQKENLNLWTSRWVMMCHSTWVFVWNIRFHTFTPSTSLYLSPINVSPSPKKSTQKRNWSPTTTITASSRSTDCSNLFASRTDLTSKEFQLEELEDREECETELWLNDNGSVTLGNTNGPLVKSYKGDWHLLETASEEDKPFRMRLTRTYEASSRWEILETHLSSSH